MSESETIGPGHRAGQQAMIADKALVRANKAKRRKMLLKALHVDRDRAILDLIELDVKPADIAPMMLALEKADVVVAEAIYDQIEAESLGRSSIGMIVSWVLSRDISDDTLMGSCDVRAALAPWRSSNFERLFTPTNVRHQYYRCEVLGDVCQRHLCSLTGEPYFAPTKSNWKALPNDPRRLKRQHFN
jgi:hypothetical protein